MKKMKHAISFVALLLMLVSMFSVCMFPVSAVQEEYNSLRNDALVVDSTWKDKNDGDPITYYFQGVEVNESFDSSWHFASYADAWAFAKRNNVAHPVILLTEGTYNETIYIEGAVTLLGSNAGVDPNVKTGDKNVAWSLSNTRSFDDDAKETIIKGNIHIRSSVGVGTVVLDGLAFVDGGAIRDHERDSDASEFTVKNCIFSNAGNAASSYYAMYLRSDGHARTLNLENLYITGQNYTTEETNTPIVGFISPYFVELFADNVAYVENKVGFIAASWFAEGVSPVVNVANSCFYNADAATPVGHVISVDNAYSNFDFNYTPATGDNAAEVGTAANPYFQNTVISKDVNKRPNAMLELKDNIFYNASATSSKVDLTVKGGVVHFQFVNSNSAVNLQGNYFYGPDGTTFMDSEFLLNSYLADQTSCMYIRNNWFVGTYKVPDLTGTHVDTYIDLSKNYFGRTSGEVVNFPVYSTDKNRRMIRTDFWVDMDLTVKNTDWNIKTEDWSLAWVDNSTYDVELYMYTVGDKTAALPIKFLAQRSGLTVELYKTAKVDADGIAYEVSESDKITKIDSSLLSTNVYEITTLYAKVIDPNNPNFTPLYTISVRNCGDLNDMPDFNAAFPGYLMSHPTAEKLSAGTFMPYRWNGKIYKMTVGKNLFPTPEEAIAYGYKIGQEIPTVCLPAGIYEDELSLPGSCTILGEKHGVNPNAKPYEYLTEDKFNSSEWTLSADRSVLGEETIFYAPIRVVEGADDYVITVDGIMMADGCSYVDDCARSADNITILKNLFALDAVGGYDRNGSENIYLFNFYKAFGPLTDRCSLYMYDCRVDGLDSEYLFGPYYEKLVIDGLYYARGRNNSYFFNNMQSRDIPNPYYSITNSYVCDNVHETQSGIYTFTTRDDQGSQAVKENIVYVMDGNVFNNGFQNGYAAMQFWWPGTNMSVNLTNNIFYQSDNPSFIAQTIGGIRYKGNCPTSDCSNILIIKGNRFVAMNRVPYTNGTGPATNFDWSGNYWSTGVGAGGATPEKINKIQPGEGTGNFTYEECTRWTIDYTYADWDMTVRQYAADYTGERVLPEENASLSFSKGPYGTGTVGEEVVNNVKMPLYRDRGVAFDVDTYASPAIVGEYDTVKYYTDTAYTNEVASLTLTDTTNTFYGVVLPYGESNVNAEGAIKFKVVIERELGKDAKLLYYPGGMIDQIQKSVFVEISGITYNLRNVAMVLSSGATGVFYADKNCTTQLSNSGMNLRFASTTHNVVYYQVTPSDGGTPNVYQIDVYRTSAGTVGGVSKIDGMTDMGNNVYQADVVEGVTKVSFTPEAYRNSSLVVTYAGSAIQPGNGGSYTVNIGDAQTTELRLIATAENGSSSTTYTLRFNRVANTSGVKILGIEGAAASSTGFGMSLGLGRIVEEIKVNVSPGATYALYEDYACTKKIADGPIVLNSESKVIYVKATSADGNSYVISRLTIYSSLMSYKAPTINGKYGSTVKEALLINGTDYTLDLPAGLNSVILSGVLEIAGKDAQGNDTIVKPKAGGEITFYADPQLKVEINANSAIELDQKITKVYYKMSAATYDITTKKHPDDKKPSVIEADLNERTGQITITSDRSAIAYSDRSAIPDWVVTYVDYLNNEKHGIFMGDQNRKLNASANITRNEIATVATRVMGLDVSKYSSVELDFADTVDAWAQPYVRAAVGSGIINGELDGYTGKIYFNGASNATREQVMKILVSVCMINEGISEDGAAYYKGHKNHVDPVYNEFDFVDEANVSEWAVPYIHLAVGKYKLVGGSLDNGKLYLNPRKSVTRAEVIKMVACYMGHE